MKYLLTFLVFAFLTINVNAQIDDSTKDEIKQELEEARKKIKEDMPDIKASLEKMKEEMANIDWDEIQLDVESAMPTDAEIEEFMDIMSDQMGKMRDIDLTPIKEMMEELMNSFENYSNEPADQEQDKKSRGKKI